MKKRYSNITLIRTGYSRRIEAGLEIEKNSGVTATGKLRKLNRAGEGYLLGRRAFEA